MRVYIYIYINEIITCKNERQSTKTTDKRFH